MSSPKATNSSRWGKAEGGQRLDRGGLSASGSGRSPDDGPSVPTARSPNTPGVPPRHRRARACRRRGRNERCRPCGTGCGARQWGGERSGSVTPSWVVAFSMSINGPVAIPPALSARCSGKGSETRERDRESPGVRAGWTCQDATDPTPDDLDARIVSHQTGVTTSLSQAISRRPPTQGDDRALMGDHRMRASDRATKAQTVCGGSWITRLSTPALLSMQGGAATAVRNGTMSAGWARPEAGALPSRPGNDHSAQE